MRARPIWRMHFNSSRAMISMSAARSAIIPAGNAWPISNGPGNSRYYVS
jgi:hypothetical protein